VLNDLTFQGSDYVVYGNPFTLTNSLHANLLTDTLGTPAPGGHFYRLHKP
jgi:hypothetical protein